MNLFNTLTKEEKIRSLIYVTNNELSIKPYYPNNSHS